MHDANEERWAAWGGLGAVVCFVLSAVIAGNTEPGKKARFDPARVAHAFTSSHNGIRAAPFIFGLGVISLLWWFGSLWRMMVRAENGQPRLAVMAGLGLISAGTLQLLHLSIDSAIAWRPLPLGASIVTVAQLSSAVSSASIFGLVAMLGAVSGLAIRTKFLPRWLAIGGVVIAVVWLVSALRISLFNGIGGLGVLAYLLWAIWILSISRTIWSRPVDVTTTVSASA